MCSSDLGRNCARNSLMAFVLVFTSLASTDLVPRHWRDTITNPLVLKALPCILAWIVMQVALLRSTFVRVESRDSEA